ncbi:MAG TPA: SPASM domain-containing protein [Alphaproteobacteria bacterium]|nr:SPASM domain-containing protein [Alphaproteobacteria bacterium]
MDIARARTIITPEFWNSDAPFFQDAYADINFPLTIGDMTQESMEDIYNSGRYKKIQAGTVMNSQDFPVYGDALTEPFPDFFKFLTNGARQMMYADRFIFNQPDTYWHFTIDIKALTAGQTHRFPGRHADSDLSDANHVRMLAEHFRKGEEFLAHEEYYPRHVQTGVTRHYTMADIFPTLFDLPLKRGKIGLYVAEDHESPVVDEDCLRTLLRGKATPIPPRLQS